MELKVTNSADGERGIYVGDTLVFIKPGYSAIPVDKDAREAVLKQIEDHPDLDLFGKAKAAADAPDGSRAEMDALNAKVTDLEKANAAAADDLKAANAKVTDLEKQVADLTKQVEDLTKPAK